MCNYSSSIEEIKKDFAFHFPPLVEKYLLNKPDDTFAFMEIKGHEIDFVLRAFRNHCKSRVDLSQFFYYINFKGNFIFSHPFPNKCEWSEFISIFEEERKHFSVIYHLLVDVHNNFMREHY